MLLNICNLQAFASNEGLIKNPVLYISSIGCLISAAFTQIMKMKILLTSEYYYDMRLHMHNNNMYGKTLFDF